MAKSKRYDELKVGDVIWWYGAKERIVAIREFPYTEDYYREETDKVINFDLEPYDEEAEEILGKFYSHGGYGGVGCLMVSVFKEAK